MKFDCLFQNIFADCTEIAFLNHHLTAARCDPVHILIRCRRIKLKRCPSAANMLRDEARGISSRLATGKPAVAIIWQHIAVSILSCILVKYLVFKSTICAHQIQITNHHAFKWSTAFRRQNPKFVDGSFLHSIGNLRDVIRCKGNNRTAGLFERSANLTSKAKLKHDFILDSLFDFIHQNLRLFVFAQFPFFNHVLIGMFPCHIRSNKEADKLFIRHALMPVSDESILKISQVLTGTELSTVFLNSSSKPKAPRSGIEETGPMCSILNIIRKRQGFLVVVESWRKHLRYTRANLSRAAETHQRKTATAATAGTDILLVVLGTWCSDGVRNQNIDHFGTAAHTFVSPFLAKFHLQTVGAYPGGNHAGDSFFMGTRKHHHDFFICAEVQIIERFKVRHCGVATFIKNRYPTGYSAITAVDNRKILLSLLLIQIICNLISDFFLIHFGNQTTKFTHPELNLDVQKWT